jgi:DNA-binding transcriptional regulator YiaG
MSDMPNVASILKEEISRVARKVLRPEIDSLKKTVASQRSQLTELKRRLQQAEKLLARQAKTAGRAPTAEVEEMAEGGQRFSAKGLKTHRQRLRLSANDMGKLLNVTGQSIYNWEDGKSKPHAKYMPAIAALRKMGKRQIAKMLETPESEQ